MGPTKRYQDEPDVILVAAAQRGERDALEALLRRHYSAVVARCRRVLSNDADASDAAQNALIAIAKGINRFDGTSSFTTWLYRVSTNAALDEVRRRNRRAEPRAVGTEPDRSPSGSAEQRPRINQLVDAAATARLESVVDREAINAALQMIPLDFRSPLILRDLCGLDYAEIADVLGIPPGTVRSRIARGRASLTPHLQRALADETAAASAASGNFSTDTERQRLHDGR